MLTASPITNQPVGKTFTIAISLLGMGAALQLVLIGWAFWKRPPLAIVVQPLPGPTRVATPAVPVTPDNTTALVDPSANVLNDAVANAPQRPTPVPVRPAQTEPSNRFEELVAQGKELRERNDTSTAIIKFREAATLDSKNPLPLAELATTYEKMGLTEKAAEQYAKIIDMGPSAGVYGQLAQAKRQAAQANILRTSAPPTAPSAPETQATAEEPDLTAPVQGIAAGALLGLLPVTTEDVRDDSAGKHFILHIPIKARPKARVEVKDLIIHVLFYDVVDDKNVVQTSANVNYKWTTPPADWVNSDVEELAADYQLPKLEARAAKRENRKYYGYIVRIYYKQRLQAATAEPQRLAQQYPPPSTLPKENEK
jgi:hypothetical protein